MNYKGDKQLVGEWDSGQHYIPQKNIFFLMGGVGEWDNFANSCHSKASLQLSL